MSRNTKSLAINGGQPVRKDRLSLYKPDLDDNDFNSVMETLKTTLISGDGPACREFEKQLAEYLGVKHALLVNSCTGALDLAYMIKEFPRESEVIIPNFTYTSTALGPVLNNLKVVLVDVDPENGLIDIDKIEEKITDKTVAISPVDYAGNPVDMDRLNMIAKKHDLYVVHDTAQSIGSLYKGKKTGRFADVSTFSFHGTKNLAMGEGGALVTDSDEIAKKVIIAREKGTDKHSFLSNPEKKGFYEYVSKGNSYVQSNILAALGLSQLKKIDKMNLRRKEISEMYIKELSEVENLKLPKITKNCETNWHIFYLLVPENDKNWIVDAIQAEGVMVNTHYHPLHMNNYYCQICDFDENEFPNSVKFYNSLIRLPNYPLLKYHEIINVITAVKKVMNALK